MPTERNSPVIEALQLLQTNPKVQVWIFVQTISKRSLMSDI
jgi:hypothetical protein